jgi:hypothetical protein
MSHIFISYSRKELSFAEKIVNTLARDGLEPWIDWKSIPKGEEFETEIQQGIEGAEVFLFLLSPASIQSSWCIKEIDHAVRNGKRILPIVIRDVEPKSIHTEISKRNWIFCREGQDDFEDAVVETQKTIRSDYKWVKFHTELQVKALRWNQKRDNSLLLRGRELRETRKIFFTGNQVKEPPKTKLQEDFINASIRHDRVQGFTWSTVVVIMLCVSCIAVVSGVILLDRVPAEVIVDGQGFAIKNRSGYQFLEVDVGSTISVYAGPKELSRTSGYIFIIGTGADGERPGTVLAYDMSGNIQWEYSANKDAYNGPTANFKIRRVTIDNILNNGELQVVFSSQKTDWYPSELVLLNAKGELLGSYWNSGFIYDVIPWDFDGDGIKELVVSAVNNNLGYVVVNDPTKHPVTVFALSPKRDFTGQTYPDWIPGLPSGTEYNGWIAVFDPYFVTGIHLRIVQDAGDHLIEVMFNPQGGYIQLDRFGRIRQVGISDYWQSLYGNKSPADFLCFLKSETNIWSFPARIDQEAICPWYVRE